MSTFFQKNHCLNILSTDVLSKNIDRKKKLLQVDLGGYRDAVEFYICYTQISLIQNYQDSDR
jgi:hypothetical protein